jgi:hypothetical protein
MSVFSLSFSPVVILITTNFLMACGPTGKSPQRRETVSETKSVEDKTFTEKEIGPSSFTRKRHHEIILPMDTLDGMSNSERAREAFSWNSLQVSFRLSLPPYSRDRLPSPLSSLSDYRNKLTVHKADSGLEKNHPYYLVVSASDFFRHICPVKDKKCQCSDEDLKKLVTDPSDMYLHPLIAKDILKDPDVKGLYIHELMSFSNNRVPNDNSFNCPKEDVVPIQWNKLLAYAAAAKAEGKKIIWNDAGDKGAWSWLEDALNGEKHIAWRDRQGAKKLFEEYGSIIVPLWANNRHTGDANESDPCPKTSTKGVRLYCDKINNSIASVKAISKMYTQERFGASIQDWHTFATFDKVSYSNVDNSTCIRRDVLNYASRAKNEGSAIFEFESYWAKDKFFEAITVVKDAITFKRDIQTNWPSPLVCVPKPPKQEKP